MLLGQDQRWSQYRRECPEVFHGCACPVLSLSFTENENQSFVGTFSSVDWPAVDDDLGMRRASRGCCFEESFT